MGAHPPPESESHILYLSAADVDAARPSGSAFLATVAEVFRLRAAGQTELPPKLAVHPTEDGFLHAMPASLPALGAMGMKWIAAYADNGARGLPAIGGLIVLNAPRTGRVLAVMDAAWITVARTAATSMLSARHLARPRAASLGILGCGAQARAHIGIFGIRYPLERVHVYDRHPERATALAEESFGSTPLDIRAVATPREVVEGMDLVVTGGSITPVSRRTIEPGWLAPGAFASILDYDSSWSRGALEQLDLLCTDDTEQLELTRSRGRLAELPPTQADLADLVSGRHPGRTSDEQRTAACNLGVGLTDVAVAAVVLERAWELRVGTWLPR